MNASSGSARQSSIPYRIAQWSACCIVRVMFRKLIPAVLTLSIAQAAELADITLPDTSIMDGTHLVLNGIGLRTYSVFNIHIYVAGLYLEHRSQDADAILRSSGRKFLDIRFVHDVSASEARNAWHDGFVANCKAPCQCDPRDVQRFLAAVPTIRSGDRATLLFTSRGVSFTINDRLMGNITDRHFAEVILACFI